MKHVEGQDEQTGSASALEGGPILSPHVRALGLCSGCGGTKFQLFIYSCGNPVPSCVDCNQHWETPAWAGEVHPKSD